MIKYQLSCFCGHEFEAWFASSAAFAEQQAQSLLSCPACSSKDVEKRPMAPAIVKGGRQTRSAEPEAEPRPLAEPADSQANAFVEAVRQMRAHIEAKSENVGRRFAEEARRIHFGETEPRAIHGEATPEDTRELDEDGVPFSVLPPLPEEKN